MERVIGDKFTYRNNTLQVIKRIGCDKCFFKNDKGSCDESSHVSITGRCTSGSRKDNVGVQFIKVNNMEEKRNIKVDLSTAKEWYKGDNITLKTLAIQAYPELKEPVIKTWVDLENCHKSIKGYFINSMYSAIEANENTASEFTKGLFTNKPQAKSALAMSQISQLIPYYGGEITNKEWINTDIRKYVIKRMGVQLYFEEVFVTGYEYLAFHNKEQRNSFLKNNEQLVKDYLMID